MTGKSLNSVFSIMLVEIDEKMFVINYELSYISR